MIAFWRSHGLLDEAPPSHIPVDFEGQQYLVRFDEENADEDDDAEHESP